MPRRTRRAELFASALAQSVDDQVLGDFSSSYQTTLAQLSEAAAIFADIRKLREEVGLGEEDGLRGKLNAAVRRAGEKLTSFTQKYKLGTSSGVVEAKMLQLRHHEKDYMLFGDPGIIAKFDASYEELLKSMKPAGFKIVGRMEMKGFFESLPRRFRRLGCWQKGS